MKNAEIVEREKMEILRDELERHPLTIKLRQDKSAERMPRRREIAARIEELRKEEGAVLPKLQAALEEAEAKHAAAKVTLEVLGDDCRTAALALQRERLTIGTTIANCEASLLESAPAEIDEAITFFTEKFAWLRSPGRISSNRIGGERNI
jgi:hypothetical protein